MEGAVIAEEERDDSSEQQHGQLEAAADAAAADQEAGEDAHIREGELSHDDGSLELAEQEEEEEGEQELAAAAAASNDNSSTSRRRSTRNKRATASGGGDRESTRAKLRRKTAELVDSAAHLITGKRHTRSRKQSTKASEEDSRAVNGSEHEEAEQEEVEHEDEEGVADQPGQPTSEQQQQSSASQQQQDDDENDQPEGTPAKARRRSSRSSAHSSRSPLRALASLLPESISSRLPAVSEDNGKGADGEVAEDDHEQQQQQYASQRREVETNEVGAEGDASEIRKAPFATLSLFDWRWLLPGLLVALLSSLALLQLFHPHLLPWSSSLSSHSSSDDSHFPSQPLSMSPLHESDWRRISSSFLPVKEWQSFKQRWERWIEDDKRRAEEIVGAVKEWVEAKLHKVEQRSSSSKDAAADVSELRSELSKRLSDARAGWLQEVDGLIEQRLASSLTDQADVRHADVQRAVSELRSEMRQRVVDELQRGTDELLNTVRDELKQRTAQQSKDSEQMAAQWQTRLTEEVKAVEKRAVDAALAVVDKRFVSSEQLQSMDDAIRRYIRDTLEAQAEQYATAEELQQVERRVMAVIQQKADSAHGAEKLSADDKKQLIVEVMQAARAEWAAESAKIKDELRQSLLQEASKDEKPSRDASGAIDALKQQLAELEQRLTSGQSKEEETSRSTHQWVEERLQSALKSVQAGGSTQPDVIKKLSELEAALEELTSANSQAAAAPSSSSSRPSSSASSSTSLSDITAALEQFAADRTNQVDYALASSGGRIVAHSPTHPAATAQSSASASFPASLVSPLLSLLTSRHLPSVPADALLDADMSVGHCWPMAGRSGSVIIGLRERVLVSGISVQHPSVNVLPDGGASMPRKLRISGVEDEELREARRQVAEQNSVAADSETEQQQQQTYVGSVLGEFEYVKGGSQVQQWSNDKKGTAAGSSSRGYQFVRLDVLSNYGNSNYTCIYRVRVHGEPVREQ